MALCLAYDSERLGAWMGTGLCVEPAHERIGVVDAQWIVYQTVPSLGNQKTERLRGKGEREVSKRVGDVQKSNGDCREVLLQVH
ncbi:uncharacterized protein LOC121794505 isoform X3 [Salvia splendens]|uniref:uncharacterized protein LOC121794505 isoform X3 n=1 Tax=Salvia splendens TaxID=180675 RepID=UPI001C25B746|nr:uncharacterized protein LOC121794505 isoform X3 [Salvia splendens]